jgi:hypothetical protein
MPLCKGNDRLYYREFRGASAKVELCAQYASIDCPLLCSGLVAVRLTPKYHRDVVECITYLVAYYP